MVWWVGWSDEWRAVESMEVVSAVRQVLGSHQIPVGSQVAVIGTVMGVSECVCVCMIRYPADHSVI